jgi:hypothetical protein
MRLHQLRDIAQANDGEAGASLQLAALAGGPVVGLELPKRVFPCATPADVRSTLPEGKDVLAFQVWDAFTAQDLG